MARSHEPPNGSDHPVLNGLKARRAAIVLFIAATFSIMAVLSLPLARNIRSPLKLPRALQEALSPAERLIRPIFPWLGPLPGSLPRGPEPARPIAAPPRATFRPSPSRPGVPPPPPPPEESPPGPPGTVPKAPTTRPPRSGPPGDGIRRDPTTKRPGSGIETGTGAGKATARGDSSTDRSAKHGKKANHAKRAGAERRGKGVKGAKHRKRAKHGKHAKREHAKHATRHKHGSGVTHKSGRKKG